MRATFDLTLAMNDGKIGNAVAGELFGRRLMIAAAATLSQATLLLRLAQSEDLREFALQMGLQNPSLARQGGERVRYLLTDMAL